MALLLIKSVHEFGAILSFHNASNVTVAQLTDVKFINVVAVVVDILVLVVVLLPYVCVTPSIHVTFHHKNVYHALVGLLTVTVASYAHVLP